MAAALRAERNKFTRQLSRASSYVRHNIMPGSGEADGDNEHSRLLPNDHDTTGASRRHRILPEHATEDERPWVRYPSLVASKTWQTLASNYVNVLLVFVPLGIISHFAHWPATSIFVLNFLAIIPLASLLSFATEELSAKLGDTLGGLLNASFGNAVEFIVSIMALRNGQIRIVQASMLGSILSNMLLVLGCCFVAGGIRGGLQEFNETVASTMSSLMLVASASLIIPASLYAVMSRSSSTPPEKKDDNIMLLSHGTAIILLVLYVMYLVFQLKTHAHVFVAKRNTDNTRPRSSRGGARPDLENGRGDSGFAPHPDDAAAAGASGATETEEEDDEPHILGPKAAAAALIVVTLLVAWCADYLVDSIDAIVHEWGISQTFIGLILLPIVGNAAEHVTAVIVSYKGKMDLAMGVAIGSSMQIALLITPFLVVLGWIIGQPMTLHFDPFETVVFFLSVLVVNYLIQDSQSNYLEGAMLLGVYLIIAIAFFVYPDDPQTLSVTLGDLFTTKN